MDLILTRLVTSVRGYVARTDVEPQWRDAALFSRSAARLTADELAGFTQEYLELVRRWIRHREAPADARPVRVAMFAYPDEGADPESDPSTESGTNTESEGGEE